MNTKIRRWPGLLAGVIMMLFSGIIYAWSILKAPLMAEFGWNNAALGLNFTVTMCFFCLGGIVGGIIVRKISPRMAAMLSSLIICMGFFISSRMNGSIFILYLSYGGMCGLGIGIVYNVTISTVVGWFPDKRATASGALMMGFGASTLVLGSIMGYLIQILGWRNAYLLLGGSITGVLIIGSLFLKPVDSSIELLAAGKGDKVVIKDELPQDYTTVEMTHRLSFWKFYILTILLSSVGSSVISFAKDVSMQVGATEAVAITFVGMLSVCNGLGRIITGWMFDNWGRRITMMIANIAAVLASVIVLLALTAKSMSLIAGGFIIVGLSYGSMPPITSGYIASFYGRKNFALNFSVANTMLFIASFSATIAGAIVNDTGSYVGVFIMLLCFAVAGLFINISIKRV